MIHISVEKLGHTDLGLMSIYLYTSMCPWNLVILKRVMNINFLTSWVMHRTSTQRVYVRLIGDTTPIIKYSCCISFFGHSSVYPDTFIIFQSAVIFATMDEVNYPS